MKYERLAPHVVVSNTEIKSQGFNFCIRLVGKYDPALVNEWLKTSQADCYVCAMEGIPIIAFKIAEDAVAFSLSFETTVDEDTDFLGVKYEEIKKAK